MTKANAELAYFDITDPEFRVDSPEVHAAAERNWYAQTPMGPAILRYADCAALIKDRRLRQAGSDHLAAQGVTSGPASDWWRSTLISMDGPEHHRQRRLLARGFTPKQVEPMRPRMREIVNTIIDDFAGRGECEFMAEFADRYPPRVMFEILGIPEAEYQEFLGWGKEIALLGGMNVTESIERIDAALVGLYDAVERLCADRGRSPREDLITALVQATEDGDQLTMGELQSHVAGFVFGGQDTARNQLGLAVHTFASHPEQWRLLADRPELAEQAVEEVMRVAPTIPIMWRVATEPFSYHDLEIPEGMRLWMFVGAAHMEKSTFGERSFDITASRQPHLTFGGGVHHCMGSFQARMEMQEALPILARRLGQVELAGETRWRPVSAGLNGPLTLPIRFTGAVA